MPAPWQSVGMDTWTEPAPTPALLRADGDDSALALRAMTMDGLLVQLTETCWAAAGSLIDARVRAAALGPPAVTGTVYSHATAHWLWWGTARAPITPTVTTRKRRRLRGEYAVRVFERSVAPDDVVDLGGVPVTAPGRTLIDESLEAPLTDRRAGARLLRTLLSEVGRAEEDEFRAAVAAMARRPGIIAVREALAELDSERRRRAEV